MKYFKYDDAENYLNAKIKNVYYQSFCTHLEFKPLVKSFLGDLLSIDVFKVFILPTIYKFFLEEAVIPAFLSTFLFFMFFFTYPAMVWISFLLY